MHGQGAKSERALIEREERKKRQGSWLTERDLARSVMAGRRITFEFPTGIPRDIHGYVIGWDAYHWKVLSFDEKLGPIERFVHKGNVAVVTLTNTTIASEQPDHQSHYESVVAAFRERLVRDNVAPSHVARRVS